MVAVIANEGRNSMRHAIGNLSGNTFDISGYLGFASASPNHAVTPRF